MLLSNEQHQALLLDPDWVDIGNLPSNFYPYTFGSLLIRPFQVKHLRLLSKAVVSKTFDFQLQAVDTVISQSVYELSIGDYFYVLEWLKIHSTTKTPLAVEWHCQEQRLKHKTTGEYILNTEQALKEAEATAKPEDYVLEPCVTHNTEMLHMVNLEILQLPEEGWDGLPEGFDFPRAAMLQEIREALLDPELNMIVGPASWVAGATLADKITSLESQPNLDMFMTAQALNDTIVHGLKQTSRLHCRTCSADHLYVVKVDSLSFFQ